MLPHLWRPNRPVKRKLCTELGGHFIEFFYFSFAVFNRCANCSSTVAVSAKRSATLIITIVEMFNVVFYCSHHDVICRLSPPLSRISLTASFISSGIFSSLYFQRNLSFYFIIQSFSARFSACAVSSNASLTHGPQSA